MADASAWAGLDDGTVSRVLKALGDAMLASLPMSAGVPSDAVREALDGT